MQAAHDWLRPAEILLVEDSPSDARLTMEVFKAGKLQNNLHHVGDGEQAMAFLHNRDPYANAPRPDMVLLDLNMPRKDGRAVLSDIRNDPHLHNLVVIVLTTSQDDADVLAVYGLKANAFVSKPVELDEFIAAMAALEKFWFSIVTLPPKS